MKEINETILEEVDVFITNQAKKLMHWHSTTGYEHLDTLELDELIQRVRIKLWKMLEKGSILRPYSYARRIVYSEFIDMKRQQKQLLPLPNDENEGVYLLKSHVPDPEDEVIQRMEVHALLQHLVQMMTDLPPRQQMAMICFLWDQVEDPELLRVILTTYGFDRMAIEWPVEKMAKRTLLASLSVARQKMVKKRHQENNKQEIA